MLLAEAPDETFEAGLNSFIYRRLFAVVDKAREDSRIISYRRFFCPVSCESPCVRLSQALYGQLLKITNDARTNETLLRGNRLYLCTWLLRHLKDNETREYVSARRCRQQLVVLHYASLPRSSDIATRVNTIVISI